MVKSRLHSPYSSIWFVPPLRYLQMYRRYVGRRIFFVFFLASIAALLEGLGITLLLPLLITLEKGASVREKCRCYFKF